MSERRRIPNAIYVWHGASAGAPGALHIHLGLVCNYGKKFSGRN